MYVLLPSLGHIWFCCFIIVLDVVLLPVQKFSAVFVTRVYYFWACYFKHSFPCAAFNYLCMFALVHTMLHGHIYPQEVFSRCSLQTKHHIQTLGFIHSVIWNMNRELIICMSCLTGLHFMYMKKKHQIIVLHNSQLYCIGCCIHCIRLSKQSQMYFVMLYLPVDQYNVF